MNKKELSIHTFTERDWKKNKILLGKEIASLEKKLNKKGNHE